jgi:hypothetical protein
MRPNFQQLLFGLVDELNQARDRGEVSHLYFIQAGADGPIKIGRAVNPVSRMCELQSGNHVELRILVALPGGYAAERAAHRSFKSFRIRGEWFRAERPLLQFIAGLQATESAA